MAKKVVATLKTGTGKNFTKVIKMVKSDKTGAYAFKSDIVPNDQIKEFFDKNSTKESFASCLPDRSTAQKARPESSGRAFCVSLSSRSAPLRETSPKEDPAKRFATLRRQHRHLPPSTLRNIPETHLAEHRCSERFRHTQGHPIAEKSGLPAGRLRCIFVTVTGRAGVRSCRTERHDHFRIS